MEINNGDYVMLDGKSICVGEMISIEYDEQYDTYVVTFEDSKGNFHRGMFDKFGGHEL